MKPRALIEVVVGESGLLALLAPHPLNEAQRRVLHSLAPDDFKEFPLLATRWHLWSVLMKRECACAEMDAAPSGMTLVFGDSQAPSKFDRAAERNSGSKLN